MITIATLFWDRNDATDHYADGYTPEWVNRLYRGFERNLTKPFRFVVFTDTIRTVYSAPIKQRLLTNRHAPTYVDCLEPYRLNVPMILVGLDTVVTGNCDHLAEYCETGTTIALPRDPYKPQRACNGVALVPSGHADVWFGADRDALPPRTADMQRLRDLPHVFLDDLYPGDVVSYKVNVQRDGLNDARIVYFHGDQKPHQVRGVKWLDEAWQ